MKPIDIVRAWKDEEYRASLNEDERALIPDHPAGNMDISMRHAFPVVITMVLPITYQPAITYIYLDALVKYTSTLIK